MFQAEKLELRKNQGKLRPPKGKGEI